ncbi:uncharacterized protein B0I36DRAFT_18902 [Microdochium trichocladiopsis]|uniref:Uncharacterized protein n=1 Tax=Microdochium trichocladiopsis TaxID=1682393 RepID=A0A9P9BWS3_9PEZI|nr:uncharacterized protein B0I36DRAFT_18902 [Microdochium trichocladiopsis]KAH7041067.1 hypothetical protein B0I36DRAFT_18902 [Microdochium trichocladiopsis]
MKRGAQLQHRQRKSTGTRDLSLASLHPALATPAARHSNKVPCKTRCHATTKCTGIVRLDQPCQCQSGTAYQLLPVLRTPSGLDISSTPANTQSAAGAPRASGGGGRAAGSLLRHVAFLLIIDMVARKDRARNKGCSLPETSPSGTLIHVLYGSGKCH